MALHKLSKGYSSDFRQPRRKPTGKVELDKSNKYGKRIFAAWNFATHEDWLLDYGSGKYAELIGDDQWLAVSDNNMNLRSVDNSNSERISVGSIDSSNPISLSNESTGGSYTIFFRCWLDYDDSVPTRIFDKSNGGSGSNGWMIQTVFGSMDFYIGGSKEVSATMPTQVWADCAITVDNGSATLYINNAKSTAAVPSTPTTTANAAIANWNHTSDRQWKGDIAYIHMHYGAYSEQQVREYWRSPYQGFKPKNDPVYFTSDVGGVPTLYPSFIPSAEEFYTASVENMLSVIEPNFIATQESIYKPEVSPQGVTILPDYIPSEEVVYSPTVADLLQVLSPDFIPTEETVYSPEVERLLQLLYPSYIESEETMYRPTVTGGDSISIPLTDRRTWNAVAQYLRDLVFTGQDNDVIQKWFLSEGYEGEYNENWNNYLADQGYTDGNLSDKYSAWRKQ